jgi:glutamate-1-semialdehyde aminotransferase
MSCAGELACVFVEMVQGSNPRKDHGAWLRGLQAVCNECGVLLAVDETVCRCASPGEGGGGLHCETGPR